MADPITPADIHRDPSIVSETATLESGEEIHIRPVRRGDVEILARYFLQLSEQTRNLFAPHPLDYPTAERICLDIDYAATLRMIATLTRDGREEVIAYFLLVLGVAKGDYNRYLRHQIAPDPASTCMLAPCVADAYQDRHVGSTVMRHVVAVAQRLGRTSMILMGGVLKSNPRAIHFYQKHAFRIVGEFRIDRDSFDMLLPLSGPGGS